MKRIADRVRQGTSALQSLLSTLNAQLYGYMRLDASYDSGETDDGNKISYAKSGRSGEGEFNMTAKQTRFGIKFKGPQDGKVVTSGKVEMDFYGSGGSENAGLVRMRKAFVNILWPESDFSILAGQENDVIAPLGAPMLEHNGGKKVGRLDSRHPQIRLTKVCKKDKSNLKLELAAVRGKDRSVTGAANDDSGANSEWPDVQGRVSATFPCGSKQVTVGLWGHYGEETFTISGVDGRFDSWSGGIDVTLPLTDCLSVKGEAHTGENLDNYSGGIGQGVNTTTMQEIGASGGWIAASLKPGGSCIFNAGGAMEDVDAADIPSGGRKSNRLVFANVFAAVNKNTDIAFELSHMLTTYKSAADGENVRGQLAFIYKH